MANIIYSVNIPVYSSTVLIEDSFLSQLIIGTCNAMNIDSSRLYSKSREIRVKYCRWIIWEIMIATKQFSYKEAGNIFASYDHSTVVHALNRLPIDLKQNDMLQAIYEGIVSRFEISMDMIIEKRERREFNKKDRMIRKPKIEV